MRRCANSTQFSDRPVAGPAANRTTPKSSSILNGVLRVAVATRLGVQGHSNLTDHHCGRCLPLSRNMITLDAALSTSKLEAVEYDLEFFWHLGDRIKQHAERRNDSLDCHPLQKYAR